jgi:hypothetical protein
MARSPSLWLGATLVLCPPELVAPNTAARNARCRRVSASATSSAASVSRNSTSASAKTASCTANPAAPPPTTKPRISVEESTVYNPCSSASRERSCVRASFASRRHALVSTIGSGVTFCPRASRRSHNPETSGWVVTRTSQGVSSRKA